ncbi:MAG TPA: methionine synthase, partial [Burkholderiales bacterium]
SVECIHSRVPMSLLKLLEGKEVMIGVIDVASDKVESPDEILNVITEAMKYLPKESLRPCTNCGMAPMHRDIAMAKLSALGAGAALARKRYG